MRASILVLLMAVACSDSGNDSAATAPTTPELARAEFQLSARILGPVQHDDDADLRITLTESRGVAARLNFLRLTCNSGSVQEWGAGNIAAERGSNRIPGSAQVVLVRHYFCPSSGRPTRLLADLTDANGFTHQIDAAPFHPDWPGT